MGPEEGKQPGCCPFYHQAVELIGRRWTGAILAVLLQGGAMRFSEIAASVPELSDRLLSERMKELEAHGLVERHVSPGPPVKVRYSLTDKGRSLGPAVSELATWARQWLSQEAPPPARRGGARASGAAPPASTDRRSRTGPIGKPCSARVRAHGPHTPERGGCPRDRRGA